MARGSSRIIGIAITVTGGIGPVGPTGPTGATGEFVIGPRGSRGHGIRAISYTSNTDGVTFELTNDTFIFISGIRGNTGQGSTANAPFVNHIGSGIPILLNETGSSGYTLFFRSITFAGGLSASISNETIFVQDNITVTGSFNSNKLLYVDYSNNTNTYYLDSGDRTIYSESVYDGVTYGRLFIKTKVSRDLLDQNNLNYSTGITQGIDHVGITMTIDTAFYGMTGTENSLTGGSWNPYLKFRASYYDVAGASGATTGIINFSQLGPYNKKISTTSSIGSCCFGCNECGYESVAGRACVDYVSKFYCDLVLGRWSQSNCYNRQNTYDCYRRGACCVNGVCVNSSYLKCTQMGGTYCSTRTCGDSYNCSQQCPTDSFAFAGSPSQGDDPTCCCKDGVMSETTENECFDLGGVSVGAPPCNPQACCEIESEGACCYSNGACLAKTAKECMETLGIFHGSGTTCSNIQC